MKDTTQLNNGKCRKNILTSAALVPYINLSPESPNFKEVESEIAVQSGGCCTYRQ